MKAAIDQTLADLRGAFESLFGTTFDDPRKSTEKPKENKGEDKRKQSKGVGISVDGKGGENENDLPQGDPKGEQYSTEQSLWEALFGGMTKSKPDKTRGPSDRFKNIKSAADDAKGADENKSPAELDTVVAQSSYTNGGNWANERFVTGDDTTLLIIYSPQPDRKNPDSTYSRKSN